MDALLEKLLAASLRAEVTEAPRLVVMNGPEDGRVFVLGSSPALIGRLTSNDVALELDPVVSRVHAEVVQSDGAFYARDMDSRNGTEVDGVRIHDLTPLKDRSLLFVGETLLQFREPHR